MGTDPWSDSTVRERFICQRSTNTWSQGVSTEAKRDGLLVSIHVARLVNLHLMIDLARLVIITARSESQREGTEDWIAKYLPDST
jgi:hypothetical protein